MDIFKAISVNISTGAISYPKVPGFKLDMDRVYRSAERFAAHCSAEMAVRHATHQQIIAHLGAETLGVRAR